MSPRRRPRHEAVALRAQGTLGRGQSIFFNRLIHCMGALMSFICLAFEKIWGTEHYLTKTTDLLLLAFQIISGHV